MKNLRWLTTVFLRLQLYATCMLQLPARSISRVEETETTSALKMC